MKTPLPMSEGDTASNYIIRTSVLVLLCCQNAGHALLARYSQGILKESYSSTEVVLVGEVLKLFVSGYLALTDKAETDAVGNGAGKLLWLLANARKIVVLVILYSIANITSYYALARVDASVYTVLLQLKIFTTAAFAVILLNRNISGSKWRALLLLVLGCILVASPTFNRPEECLSTTINSSSSSSSSSGSDSSSSGSRYLAVSPTAAAAIAANQDEGDDDRVSVLDSVLGVFSVLLMVTISGYSAIYFESMLKKTGEKVTIWERNFQLAFYSILLLLGIVVWEMFQGADDELRANHFMPFKGWTINTVLIAMIQAGGGLLVAATLKYADAILKTLATSGSIVLSAILGYLLLGGSLDIFVCIGCVATILAIFNYTLDG